MRGKLQHFFWQAKGAASASALALLLLLPMTSFAAEGAFEGLKMRMGSWDVHFFGNVNAFGTDIDCDADSNGQTVDGGLACGSFGSDFDSNNVQTGLLPSWLGFNAKNTTDSGFTSGVTLGFQPGVDSGRDFSAPLGNSLGLNSSNFRQVFIEFGNKDQWGSFKLGRDLGVFGSDAILNDMTLLGVGTVSDLAATGGNTTLGRIGVGYIYADWKAQIQYTSPTWNGFSFTAALVDPWGTGSIANLTSAVPGGISATTLTGGGNGQESDTFGFEAKVNYGFDTGDFSGKLWASYITQSVEFDDPLNVLADDSPDSDGFDVGGRIEVGPVSLVGYYYDGDGIGTTDYLLDAFSANGESRDSDGGYIQGMFTLPNIGTKLGVSWGESNLDDNTTDRLVSGPGGVNLVETNESWVLGVYHPVNEALNLVIEYTNTEAEAHNGTEAEEDTLAIGAIMFF